MPQIGSLELLIIVILAILIIGPKDFPIILKKMGSWVSYIRRYFSEIQNDITDLDIPVEDKEPSKKTDITKKIKENEQR